MILRSIGSLYRADPGSDVRAVLVFFMLAGNGKSGTGRCNCCSGVATDDKWKETLDDLREVLRDYLAGMIVLTLLVVAMSSLFFWALGRSIRY